MADLKKSLNGAGLSQVNEIINERLAKKQNTLTGKQGQFVVFNANGDPEAQTVSPGATGADGKSAYQSAVEAGYTGTEAEFYAALVTLQDAPFLPLSGGDMAGRVDMQNHVITGLPTPVAPSDAVNYQTLIDAIAGKINYAKIILSGVDRRGNYASMSKIVSVAVEGTYSTDTILKFDHTIQYQEMIDNGITSVSKIEVELSPSFKFPTTGDWSYVPGYSPLLEATAGILAYSIPFSGDPVEIPVVYSTGDIPNIDDNIRVNGYVKVGVNA